MEPFRALVADLLPSDQRTLGFAVQSFFIGVGAVVASALPWLFTHVFGVSNTAPVGEIPPSVVYSFAAGAVAFLTAVSWTVFRTKEYPPEDLEAFRNEQSAGKGFFHGAREVMSDLRHMPLTMARLAVVQFFSWFALFAMWIYTTAAVTSHVFGASDPTTAAYNEGADWVGVLFSAYNGFAAVVAFALPPLAKRITRKGVHLLSLMLGGAGLASFSIIGDPMLLLLPMLGVGLAWASILSMPYAILAGSIPSAKMGVYMGIFNFFIVIPQIVAAGILGYFMRTVLGGDAMNALVLGGGSMIVAGLLVTIVPDADDPARSEGR
jgi:maltose/moltooligosaccharide transporter